MTTSTPPVATPVEKPAALPDRTIMPARTVAARGIARKTRSFSTPRAGGFSLNTYSGSNTASLLINIEGPDQAPARLALSDNYGTLKVVSKPAADFATLVDPASKTLASTVMVSLYVPETRTPWSIER